MADTTLYQTNLQNWFGDTAFWTDMAAYVSDWSQEVYPDWRKTAVPGSTAQQRRDYLNDYLQHQLVLARVAPPTIEPARTYIQSAYAPLASAAWSWDTGYGWSAIPYDQMQSFVSLQVYALRAFSVALGQPQDHWGFAWAPRNVRALVGGLHVAVGPHHRPVGRRDPRLGRGLQPGGPRDRGMHEHVRERVSRAGRSPSSGSRSARGRSRC